MLSGNLIRVTHRKEGIHPKFLKSDDPILLELAERLLEIFRLSGQSRLAEIEESLEEIETEGPLQLIQRGLAKVLMDRSEFDTNSTLSPETIREQAFKLSQQFMKQTDWSAHPARHRDPILRQLAEQHGVPVNVIETTLYADLKSEQRLIRFDDLSAERLLHRYNVALVQALLCRCVRLECWLRKLPATRSRQLARAAKFHRLIAVWQQPTKDHFHLALDGPLSLFSQTQKYGLQLSNFFPHILHCEQWEMTAHLLWGPEKMPKVLALNNKQGLISHVPDFGSYRPAELEVFERSFLKHAANWKLIVEPLPIALKTDLWFPDYILEYLPTAKKVPLEILGFWRKIDLEKLILKIQESFTGQFLIVVSEDRLIDESLSEIASQSIVTFKKTATADGVIQAACRLLGLPAKTKTD